MTKRNEAEFGTMMRHYGFYAYKFGDRRYVTCPKCHSRIKYCPICKQEMMFKKAQTKPDFLVSPAPMYIEAKEAKERFSWKQMITPTQYDVMLTTDPNQGWLFLLMGAGRAPKGRGAYFIPWFDWIKAEEELEEQGFKSIIWERKPRSKTPTVEYCFAKYRLYWHSGHWVIPQTHVFWSRHNVHLKYWTDGLNDTRVQQGQQMEMFDESNSIEDTRKASSYPKMVD